MDWKRWLPTSKMTAVLLTGIMYAGGLWLLITYYDLDLPVANAVLTQTWVVFIVGYSVTENRFV